ncbi:ABC transporter substrate-binding protein [Falsibacillus albus]|nr:ABC transporter substrate-binding protein [Falsibacillus albus]
MDERYFSMRATFFEREQDQECYFKLKELEALWFCSAKNVKRILHHFEESGKVTYIPGKGRGNPSKLVFLSPFQQEVEHFIKESVENDRLDQAAQLLRLPIPKSWIAKASSEIREMFGFQQGMAAKDILHSFISREITTLDPTYTSVTFESHLVEQLGDTLVKYDPKEDKIIPHIAHHYEVDEAGLKWIFYLRKGVLFHHQETLTSRDVETTIERLKQGPSAYTWLVKEIIKVECAGDYEVHLHLSKPNPFLLRYLSCANFCVLPASTPFNENEWIGSGPFSMKERSRNKLVLEAFDGYFKERPLLDEIHFYKVSQDAAEVVNYTVDNGESVEPSSTYEIETGFRFLAFNFHRQSTVKNASFRKAIYHLLDMKKMARDLQWPDLIEASSFTKERSFHQKKDPSEIPNLLKASGYAGEELHLYHLNYANSIASSRWFDAEAKKYGINLTMHPFSIEDFYKREIDQHSDMIFMGEVSTLDTHLSFLGAFYNETLLFRRLFPAENLRWIDEKLEQFKQTPTNEKREGIMKEIEAHIRAHNLLIFQHHPIKTRTFHPMIKDVEFQSYSQLDFKKLWIK